MEYSIYQKEFDTYLLTIIYKGKERTYEVDYEELSFIENILVDLGFEEKSPNYMS